MSSISRRDVLKTAALSSVFSQIVGAKVLSDVPVNNDLILGKVISAKEIVLNNQRIFNESQTDCISKDYSLKIIDKLFDKMVSGNLFSLQPFTQNEGLAFYFKRISSDAIVIESVELKCEDVMNRTLQWNHGIIDNSTENDIVEVLADSLAIEIDRRNIHHCMKHAATVVDVDLKISDSLKTLRDIANYFYVELVKVGDIVGSKTLGKANRIVASAEISALLEKFCDVKAETQDHFGLGVQHVGLVNNRWELYKDPLFPVDKVLIAYRGDSNLDSGYIYSPHIIFNGYSEDCIITSVANGFIPDGENYYAVINLKNFI